MVVWWSVAHVEEVRSVMTTGGDGHVGLQDVLLEKAVWLSDLLSDVKQLEVARLTHQTG
jgi:hypothetical protein